MYNEEIVQTALQAVELLEGYEQKIKRTIWVVLKDVPLIVWSNKLFNDLGSLWGSVVSIHEDTCNRTRFDEARVLLEVQYASSVPEECILIINGRAYTIKNFTEDHEEERVFIDGFPAGGVIGQPVADDDGMFPRLQKERAGVTDIDALIRDNSRKLKKMAKGGGGRYVPARVQKGGVLSSEDNLVRHLGNETKVEVVLAVEDTPGVQFGGSRKRVVERSDVERTGVQDISNSMLIFEEFISKWELVKVPISGSVFTWFRVGSCTTTNIKKACKPFKWFNHWEDDHKLAEKIRRVFLANRGKDMNSMLLLVENMTKDWAKVSRELNLEPIEVLEKNIDVLESLCMVNASDQDAQSNLASAKVKSWTEFRKEERECSDERPKKSDLEIEMNNSVFKSQSTIQQDFVKHFQSWYNDVNTIPVKKYGVPFKRLSSESRRRLECLFRKMKFPKSYLGLRWVIKETLSKCGSPDYRESQISAPKLEKSNGVWYNILHPVMMNDDSLVLEVRYVMGNGTRIDFWSDNWTEVRSLKLPFPRIYGMAIKNRERFVSLGVGLMVFGVGRLI
ncbi:hypothetical protein F3Y22_tig00111648pilonHSYRG00183 [Hibiscus syriacus]|uniref:DUF4283 domain-containing protein n=1 Tax=Hibiscus syriacus TaxID=106335 RepID=A0A6A2XJG6_HIBSY|nr:hypothetical protein F3Y22_tig00111648pilonHSYRG00183 [Hibiscus syriacus]